MDKERSTKSSPVTRRSFAAAFGTTESKKKKKAAMPKNVEEAVEAQEEEIEGENGVEGLKSSENWWTEAQQIEILNGMIEYKSTKGIDPMADKDDFYVFIRKSFASSKKPNVEELFDKITKLKKKYTDKRRYSSKKPNVRPHDLQCHKLAKIIWPAGYVNNGSTTVKKNKQTENVVSPSPVRPRALFLENGDGINHISVGGPLVFFDSKFANQILTDAADLVSGSSKNEMEEEMKILKLKGMELLMMETEFLRKQAEVVIESIKSQQG